MIIRMVRMSITSGIKLFSSNLRFPVCSISSPMQQTQALDVLRDLPIEKRLKILQISVVYPKTSKKIQTERAVCEGEYMGDVGSFKQAIKAALESKELAALGVKGALECISSDFIGFCVDAVDYVVIERIGVYLVKFCNKKPCPDTRNDRASTGRTLFLGMTDMRNAAASI